MRDEETPGGETDAAVDPRTEDREPRGSPSGNWPDEETDEGRPDSPDPRTIWGSSPPRADRGDATEAPDVASALARVEGLERSAEELRAFLLTTDLRSVGPRAVEEVVQRSLGLFAEEVGGRLRGLEERLENVLSAGLWGGDGDDRPLGPRVDEALEEIRDQLEQTHGALGGAVGDAVSALVAELSSMRDQVGAQATTNESLEARIERLTVIVEELAERRGLRRLAQAEERLRAEQTALAETLVTAGQDQSVRIEQLEARVHEELAGVSMRWSGGLDDLQGKLAEFAETVRGSLESSLGEIGVGVTSGFTALEERIAALESVTREGGTQAEIASLRDAIERAERVSREDIGGLTSRLAEFAETVRGSLDSSLREAIERIEHASREDADGLSGRLTEFAQALQQGLQGSIGQILSDLSGGIDTLRERIDGLERAAQERDGGVELASLRESIERIELASREEMHGLTGRLAEFAQALQQGLQGSIGRIQSDLTGGVGALNERIDGLERTAQERDAGVELASLREAIERIERASREDADGLSGRLAEFAQALQQALQGSIGQILSDLSGGIDTLRERIDGLERAAQERDGGVELASLREAIERIERASREDADGLSGRLTEFAQALQQTFQGSIGRIQSDLTAGVGALRERIDAFERAAQEREEGGELASLREAVERVERVSQEEVEGLTGRRARFARAVQQTLQGAIAQIRSDFVAGVNALNERIDGLERTAQERDAGVELASLREAIERIERASREDTDGLSGRLTEFAQALQQGLQGSIGQILSDLSGGIDTLRERIDGLERAAQERDGGVELASLREAIERIERAAQERDAGVELASLREAIERIERASREDTDGLSGRLTEFAQALQQGLQGSIGQILSDLSGGIDTLRERIDGLERTAREGDGGVDLDSLRGAVERVELTSRADVEGLTGRLAEFAETVREALQSSLGEIRAATTAVVSTLGQRIDDLEGSISGPYGAHSLVDRVGAVEDVAKAQAAAVQELRDQIMDSLAGLGSVLGRLERTVDGLETWWGGLS